MSVEGMNDVPVALARAFHDEYRRQRIACRGDADATPSMVPWDTLSEEFRASSRRNARDLISAVTAFGYEVRFADEGESGGGVAADDIDPLAERLHELWAEERLAGGWQPGPTRDDERRIHPDLVEWSDLAGERREIDRHLVRELPRILGSVGLGLFRTG